MFKVFPMFAFEYECVVIGRAFNVVVSAGMLGLCGVEVGLSVLHYCDGNINSLVQTPHGRRQG